MHFHRFHKFSCIRYRFSCIFIDSHAFSKEWGGKGMGWETISHSTAKQREIEKVRMIFDAQIGWAGGGGNHLYFNLFWCLSCLLSPVCQNKINSDLVRIGLGGTPTRTHKSPPASLNGLMHLKVDLFCWFHVIIRFHWNSLLNSIKCVRFVCASKYLKIFKII